VYESKVLERAVTMILEPIYEQEFYDCSYGFRPGRGPHDALSSLWEQVMALGGCWLIDADVQQYFDSVNFQHLRSFLDRRVRDGVIRELIDKWLKAGVWEEGQVSYPASGTPQGGVISPMLSNIYLHEVLDRWFHEQILPRLEGRAFLIRFADDFVIGCERRRDAERIMEVLPKRFAKYALTIHPQKTRLVDFRRPPLSGETTEKPGTFDFLGFTHHWGRSRRGKWVVKRRTAKDRLQRALCSVGEWCRRHRHLPIGVQAAKLAVKLRGHYQYYGVSGNDDQLRRLWRETHRLWRKWLNRRTRGDPMNWEQFCAKILAHHPLPAPRIVWSVARIIQRQEQRRNLPGLQVAAS
jgi:group II intron reverse transcriptase/maturase